ncbi:MAG: hypothetical protein MR567_09290 [Oscillospiraceae bacterium]|nr:hypothetical protein [Oscillospiraceae bacterium]
MTKLEKIKSDEASGGFVVLLLFVVFMLEYKYYYQDYGDIEFKVISANEWIENWNNEKTAEIQSQPQQ